ncbi:hypothetical protein, partial [Mycobacterium timonense]|uniref:hypothetical protein n=1 Tax=Mycobacterium timonense TaxID=701043 RepID=UPI001B80E1A9
SGPIPKPAIGLVAAAICLAMGDVVAGEFCRVKMPLVDTSRRPVGCAIHSAARRIALRVPIRLTLMTR